MPARKINRNADAALPTITRITDPDDWFGKTVSARKQVVSDMGNIELSVDGPDEVKAQQEADLEAWVRALVDDESEDEIPVYSDAPLKPEKQSRSVRKTSSRGAGHLTLAPVPAKPSQKQQIINLYQSGHTELTEIVYELGVKPSYAAEVLQEAGLLTGYSDLYTSTDQETNFYSRFFHHVLSFKTIEAAEKSVERIDRLYHYFERVGDRAGQHHAMVIALTGKNRARWSGKHAAAAIFAEWLAEH